MSRRIRIFMMALGLLGALGGCADLTHTIAERWSGRDCRPEKLQNGQCVATR